MSEILAQYKSFSSDRVATVCKRDGEYEVRLYQGEELIETRSMKGHNQRYAEDAAENLVNGVINIKGSWVR